MADGNERRRNEAAAAPGLWRGASRVGGSSRRRAGRRSVHGSGCRRGWWVGGREPQPLVWQSKAHGPRREGPQNKQLTPENSKQNFPAMAAAARAPRARGAELLTRRTLWRNDLGPFAERTAGPVSEAKGHGMPPTTAATKARPSQRHTHCNLFLSHSEAGARARALSGPARLLYCHASGISEPAPAESCARGTV